eukprot:IDg1561t1
MANNDGAAGTFRAKRFRFTSELELKFVQCVELASAHIATFGEVETAFNSVMTMFCSSREFLTAHESGMPAPKLSTLRSTVDEIGKGQTCGREEKHRCIGYRRSARRIGGNAGPSHIRDGEGTPNARKKHRKGAVPIDLTGDAELDIMEADAAHRREIDKKRIEIDERRLALEEKRFEQEKEERKAQVDLMRALIAKLG